MQCYYLIITKWCGLFASRTILVQSGNLNVSFTVWWLFFYMNSRQSKYSQKNITKISSSYFSTGILAILRPSHNKTRTSFPLESHLKKYLRKWKTIERQVHYKTKFVGFAHHPNFPEIRQFDSYFAYKLTNKAKLL